jgi:hypothetical protein
MKIGHIEEEEMQRLIQQLQNIINNTDQEGSQSDEQNHEINDDHRSNKINRGKFKRISSCQFSVFS